MIAPINDNLLVEIESDSGQFVSTEETHTHGIVLAVSDTLVHYGSFGWAFESSFLEDEKLERIKELFSALVGKRVYWEERSDLGVTIERDGKKYGLIKFSKLIAWEEADGAS